MFFLRLRTHSWHTFIPHFLSIGSGALVDLGANKGGFVYELCEQYSINGLAVEPVQVLHDALRETKRVKKVRAALSGEVGEASINVGIQDDSSSLLDIPDVQKFSEETVSVLTLESILDSSNIENVTLLKIDIEGSEIAMIDGCSDDLLSRIEQMTIEFHDFIGLVDIRDVERIISRLESLGFLHIKFSRTDHTNDLFVNLNRIELTYFDIVFIKYFWRAALRVSWVVGGAFRRVFGEAFRGNR